MTWSHRCLQSSGATRRIVNFVNHEPFAAKNLEIVLENLNDVSYLASSIFAVPETICTPRGYVLVSSNSRSNSALVQLTPTLRLLGHLETFPGDIGYGSLIAVCLIQTLYFGMTGYELAILVLEKYSAQADTVDRFVQLAQDILPDYFSMFFRVVRNSVRERDWSNTYVPAKDLLALVEMHRIVFTKMNIVDDIYNNVYVKYLEKTVAEDPKIGASAVIQQYSSDNYRLGGSNATDEL